MLGGTEVERPLDDPVIQIGPESLFAKRCDCVIGIKPVTNEFDSLVPDLVQIGDCLNPCSLSRK